MRLMNGSMQEDVLVTIQGNQDRLIYEANERDLASIPTLAYVIRDLGRGAYPLAQ